MKNLGILLLLLFSLPVANAQKIEVTAGREDRQPYSIKPGRVLGETEEHVLTLDFKSENKVTSLVKMEPYIRIFDKKRMMPRGELLLDNMYTGHVEGASMFLGAALLPNNLIAVGWYGVDKRTINLTWYNAKTLKQEGEVDKLFDLPDGAMYDDVERNYQIQKAGNVPVFDISMAVSHKAKFVALSLLKGMQGQYEHITTKAFSQPGEMAYEAKVETAFNTLETGHTWQSAVAENGDVVHFLRIHDEDGLEGSDLQTGWLYARLGADITQVRMQKLDIEGVADKYYGRLHLQPQGNAVYVASTSLASPEYMIIGKIADNANETLLKKVFFTPKAHAAMKNNFKKFDKYLDKAEGGKSYFHRDLAFSDVFVDQRGKFIFTLNEYDLTIRKDRETGREQSRSYKYGKILVTCASLEKGVEWSHVIHRRANKSSSFYDHQYWHKAVMLPNGKTVLMVNEETSSVEGYNLNIVEEGSRPITMIVMDASGFNAYSLNVSGMLSRHYAIPRQIALLANGTVLLGATPWKRSQVDYMQVAIE